MKVPPIRAVVKIEADLERVWNAIFNERGWDDWFTEGMEVEPREGGRIKFRWIVDGEEVIDRGITRTLIPNRLWEFEWNEYEDGFRSRTTIRLFESHEGGTWVEIEDRVVVLKEDDLEIAFNCAVGWGEFMTRLKLFVERGIKV